MKLDGIATDRFAEWLSLDVSAPPRQLASWIVDQVPDDPAPRRVKKQMAKVAVTLRDQMLATSGEGAAVFATWLLLEPGGQLLKPRSAAYASLVAKEHEGITAGEFIEWLLGGIELYQPAEVTELPTPLGPAHLVRARVHRPSDHGLMLFEVVAVVWVPEGDDVALTLSTIPIDDLVLVEDIARAVVELAESVRHDDGTDSA